MYKYLFELGRIKIFLSSKDQSRLKEVPAKIANKCDLIIGQGLSTTSIESFLSGKISLHADLSNLSSFRMKKIGLNKFIYQSKELLKSKIISFSQADLQNEHQKLIDSHKSIDPFQDGDSYKRIGFCLSRLQNILKSKNDYKVCLNTLKNEYNSYIAENYNSSHYYLDKRKN